MLRSSQRSRVTCLRQCVIGDVRLRPSRESTEHRKHQPGGERRTSLLSAQLRLNSEAPGVRDEELRDHPRTHPVDIAGSFALQRLDLIEAPIGDEQPCLAVEMAISIFEQCRSNR